MNGKIALQVAAIVAAIPAGVAGASVMTSGGGHDIVHGAAVVQPDSAGAEVRAVARDPSGHQPWAVRIYRSQAGWTCPEVGRLKTDDPQDSDFGQVDQDGAFRANDVQAAGSCVDLDHAPMSVAVNHYPARTGRGHIEPARAVLFGVMSSTVQQVTLAVAGQDRELLIKQGSFLAVLNEDEVGGAVLTAVMRDGSTKSYHLRAETSVTDPPPTS